MYIKCDFISVKFKIGEFIMSSDPKLREFLEKLNSGTIDFYQLEPITFEQQQFSVKDGPVKRDSASSLLNVQPVEYDADSEADTIHNLPPRPSLHRRRSTFKKEKSRKELQEEIR